MRYAAVIILPVAAFAVMTAAPAFSAALAGRSLSVTTEIFALGRDDGSPEPGEPYAFAPLNLRSGPSLSSSVKTVIPAGTGLALVGEGENGFVPVVHQGETGWVYAAYVAPPGVTSVAGVSVATTTDALNLRTGPSLNHAVQEVLPAGAVAVVIGEPRNGFLPVTYDGRPGYASADYLDVE